MAKRSRARRAEASSASRKVRLSSGTSVPLDGDLVFLVDALYKDFAVKRGLTPAYGDLQRELERILDQMDPEATREYLTHSLFLNYVTYENEMAERLAERLTQRAKAKKFRRRG